MFEDCDIQSLGANREITTAVAGSCRLRLKGGNDIVVDDAEHALSDGGQVLLGRRQSRHGEWKEEKRMETHLCTAVGMHLVCVRRWRKETAGCERYLYYRRLS